MNVSDICPIVRAMIKQNFHFYFKERKVLGIGFVRNAIAEQSFLFGKLDVKTGILQGLVDSRTLTANIIV